MTIQFTIQRDKNATGSDGTEYWVYDDILGVEERNNYVVIRTAHISSFILKEWVVDIREIN
tara:strand:- start:2564 stop:2746 length:183 start_codon:yes stop_codon:yes gene_type:complete